MDGGTNYDISVEEFKCMLEKVEYGKKNLEKRIIEGRKQMILLFPNENKLLCDVVYKHLNHLVKNYDYITVFTTFSMPDISLYTELDNYTVIVNEEEMDCMVRYASMVGLNSLKIVSLNIPVTQKAERLINYRDIDLDKIVLRGLFGFMEEIH